MSGNTRHSGRGAKFFNPMEQTRTVSLDVQLCSEQLKENRLSALGYRHSAKAKAKLPATS